MTKATIGQRAGAPLLSESSLPSAMWQRALMSGTNWLHLVADRSAGARGGATVACGGGVVGVHGAECDRGVGESAADGERKVGPHGFAGAGSGGHMRARRMRRES